MTELPTQSTELPPLQLDDSIDIKRQNIINSQRVLTKKGLDNGDISIDIYNSSEEAENELVSHGYEKRSYYHYYIPKPKNIAYLTQEKDDKKYLQRQKVIHKQMEIVKKSIENGDISFNLWDALEEVEDVIKSYGYVKTYSSYRYEKTNVKNDDDDENQSESKKIIGCETWDVLPYRIIHIIIIITLVYVYEFTPLLLLLI